MRIIMTADDMERTLARIAHEIVEKFNREIAHAVMVGIRTRGLPLAQRLQARLRDVAGVTLPLGALDITLYRDDLTQIGPAPLVRKTELPFRVTDRPVFLVDDVLFTGRTIRAALDELIDYGRPRTVRLFVFIDRGHRELPIQPDVVGQWVATELDEIVHVLLREIDGRDGVVVTRRTEPLNFEALV
ncbi:MAG: bifunctional pyr operon transcriptional regulator/uracil phosphoribosyltransferase PyrR [Acidobacteria bacterium]|nr:bifunctional pyr operon transcriptional regulator/uracil phosphoribosyltransferase PyrR [Acidobacteriota bacterium]MDW7983898.1 bifunctional pyr operon transcriptional regulator/uracil phosphoribosyltransferase PyrR [Acidobacteriota bacterium]